MASKKKKPSSKASRLPHSKPDEPPSSPTSFANGMHRLARETRLSIFEFALTDAVPGITPALVKTLRSHPFYQEVLKAWYDTNVMRLGPGRGRNSYSVVDLSEEVLKLIRNLKVVHKSHRYIDNYNTDTLNIYPDLTIFTPKITLALNIRSLNLDFSALDGFDLNFDIIVENWLKHFKFLRSLTIVFQALKRGRWGLPRAVVNVYWRNFDNALRLNGSLGVDAVDGVNGEVLVAKEFDRRGVVGFVECAVWEVEMGRF